MGLNFRRNRDLTHKEAKPFRKNKRSPNFGLLFLFLFSSAYWLGGVTPPF